MLSVEDALGLADNPVNLTEMLAYAVPVLAAEVRRLRRLMDPEPGVGPKQHEADAQEFLLKVREVMVDAMKLSTDVSPAVFGRVSGLTHELRDLFREGEYQYGRRLKERLRERFREITQDI